MFEFIKIIAIAALEIYIIYLLISYAVEPGIKRAMKCYKDNE